MEKTLKEYLTIPEIQENPFLLEGKVFSDAQMIGNKEDKSIYTLKKVWNSEGGKILANYSSCDFWRKGLVSNAIEVNLRNYEYLLNCKELIDTTAEIEYFLAMGVGV